MNYAKRLSGIVTFLYSKYPSPKSAGQSLKLPLANSFAVFLFFLVYKPFGLGRQEIYPLVLISFGFAATAFVVIAANALLLFRIIKNLFRQHEWRTYHQVLWLSWQITTVAGAILFYVHTVGQVPITPLNFLRAQTFTLLFAIIPISFGFLSYRNRILEQHSRDRRTAVVHLRGNGSAPNDVVVLQNESGTSETKVPIDALLYVCSADNYVEIWWRKDNRLERALLRNTLRGVQQAVASHPTLVRCHKSYIVNIKNLVSLEGNSMGGKLVLDGVDKKIPVSRRHVARLKGLL